MKVKCHNCGYEWDTSSDMNMVTCPSCGYKTPRDEKAPETPKRKTESETHEEKVQTGVRNLNTKSVGIVAVVVAVIVGVGAGFMLLGGEEAGPTGPSETGGGTAGASWHSSVVYAGPVIGAASHIENLYFMDHSKSYDNTTDLRGNENILEKDTTDVIMTSSSSFTENLPYETPFDMVIATRSDDNKLAYVSTDNIKVELGVTGDFNIGPENHVDSTDATLYTFDSGADYLRCNTVWDNGGSGFQVNPNKSIIITVKLWQYY